jgi:hypothetical protein
MSSEPLDPIPLSDLQHWAYSPCQSALIHVEQVFEENIFTQHGQALHKRVDDPGFEVRDGLRVERALPLFCDRLDLVGKGDVVDFWRMARPTLWNTNSGSLRCMRCLNSSRGGWRFQRSRWQN